MPNKIFSNVQKLEILQKYKNYAGSLAAFCKIQQVSKTTFYKWLKNSNDNNNFKFIYLKYISQIAEQNI